MTRFIGSFVCESCHARGVLSRVKVYDQLPSPVLCQKCKRRPTSEPQEQAEEEELYRSE
jgi:hypothetical protein